MVIIGVIFEGFWPHLGQLRTRWAQPPEDKIILLSNSQEKNIYVYTNMCMYRCIYTHVQYTCVYVRIIYTNMHGYAYTYMPVLTYVCMCVCMCIYVVHVCVWFFYRMHFEGIPTVKGIWREGLSTGMGDGQNHILSTSYPEYWSEQIAFPGQFPRE